ncbi:MAG: IPT/TIG domain-containing protein [Candidatus Omnitrophica bacterium]|nr:IPT/TIG domain-containing protein [Candidatus Omnitrophota bacterium]
MEIQETFAMPAALPLGRPDSPILPKIAQFSPQVVTGKESVFVYVTGMGFQKASMLVINGFSIRNPKYVRVVDANSLIVKVPKGVPRGKYTVAIKNPDGKTSNKVSFEVRG